MRSRRLALAVLVAGEALVGFWALAAPRSFYDDFVFGRAWVALDGPYNEHLVRDVGGLNLALALVTLAAAVALDRRLVRLVAAATLLYAVPHLAYHASALEPFPVADAIALVISLAFQVVLPLWLLVSPGRARSPAAPGV